MMNEQVTNFFNRIQSMYDDVSLQDEIKQIKSQSLLQEINATEHQYKFNFIETRIRNNALGFSYLIEKILNADVDNLSAVEPLALQSALIWENLGRLNENTGKITAFMNSAIQYEIAGYQANASCLSRHIQESITEDKSPVLHLASLFIQRKFLGIIMLSKKYFKEPTSKDGIELAGNMGLAFSAMGFSEASKFFLNGEKHHLEKAHDFFQESQNIFVDLGCEMESNIINGVQNLLPIMTTRSTWKNLLNVIPGDNVWIRYLKLLARGFSPNLLNSHSISELWPSQLNAINHNLLSAESKIVKMPTSSGKTRVAELSMVHTLITKPNSKCVYVAPYRALVWELEKVFLDLFGDLGFNVSSIMGSYETDEFEDSLIEEADIIILTPEKLDLLFRTNPEYLEKVELFILDEGHIVNEGQRGIKFELLLTRLQRKLKHSKFLFLSAVFSNETLEDFASWLKIAKDDLIEDTWRPTIQRYAEFNWAGKNGIIRYSTKDENPLIEGFVPGVITQNNFEFINPDSRRINRPKFPKPENRSQTAAELAYQFSKIGPVLVFCSQTNNALSVGKAMLTRLKYSRLSEEVIPQYFIEKKNIRSITISEQWLGKDHIVTQLLYDGIGIHHGRLPDPLRKAIETDYRERKLKVIIATTTLAQGVNLPINTVIIHSCKIFSDETFSRRRIPGRDYWNIAGRAGRAGQETEGTIIHISMNADDKEDFEYYSEQRQKLDPTRTALFYLMEDLYFARISSDELRNKLDSELIALLVEESFDDPEFKNIENFLDETLTQKQLIRYGRNVKSFYASFKNAAKVLRSSISDDNLWKIYSKTGLSTKSCETIKDFVKENKKNLEYSLQNNSTENLIDTLHDVVNVVSNLEEIRPIKEIDVDYFELLDDWMSGTNVSEFSKKYDKNDTMHISDFIGTFFGYRLPWGISGFLKIACYILEMPEKNLPDNIKFLPSMVKHGVFTPTSSWAMSLGIPLRSIAIDFAIKYSKTHEESTYKEFLNWLGSINEETLRKEFHLSSPILEDVLSIVSRKSTNSELRNPEYLKKIHDEESPVKGISYENYRIFLSRTINVGDVLELVRDYDNTIDRNAIFVKNKGQELGYVDKQIAQLLATEIDCGDRFSGTVTKIIQGDSYPTIQYKITKHEKKYQV